MNVELYRAISFGFGRTEAGVEQSAPSGMSIAGNGIAMVEGAESVRQALLLLLSTSPGERVMRPTYGCDLHRLVFYPNDDTTAGLAMHYVRQAVDKWEPRVRVIRVDAGRRRASELAQLADTGDRLFILLDYQLRRTGQADRISVSVDLSGGTP